MAKQDQERGLRELHALIDNGSTVYTVIRSVSRSGMSRVLSAFVWDGKANLPIFLDGSIVAAGIASARQTAQGFKVNGCGMDMGFHVVNQIEQATGLKLSQRWI